jgi:hypothetical protein
MNHFDYLKSINITKDDIMVDDISEKSYSSYMVNRGLSYFNDTVAIANEMNFRHTTPARMQYDFIRQMVRKRKRFSEWYKSEKIEDLEAVKEYYGYSNQRAREVLGLLSKENLKYIHNKIQKGGKTKTYK